MPAWIEEASGREVGVVPVEPAGGDRRIRQPVERDVVEDIVLCQAFRLPVEDAGDHVVAADVVVEHPGREADRGIDDAVERLRPVVHLDGVTEPVLVEVVELVPRPLLVGG